MADPARTPLQEKLDAQQKALEARAAPPPAPETGGLFGRGGTLGLGLGDDPWEATMSRTVNPAIERALGTTTKNVSQYVLPQNAVDLAIQGLTLGSPVGRALGTAGMKGLGGVGARMLTKGAETAAGAAGTAALTGHKPGEAALAGALGGAVGQGVGEGVAAGVQKSTVGKMVADAGRKVQGAMRSIFNDTLIPASESAAASVKRIINGDVVSEVQKDIGTLLGRKYFGNAPAGFETDATVLQLAKDAANKGLDIWKTKGTPSLGKMWAQLPEARQELSRFLAPADQVKFGQESAKLRAAQLAQDFFTQGRPPIQASEALFEKGTGNFTPQGLADLQRRFGSLTQQELALLGPGAKELGEALGQDAAKGVQIGVTGQAPEVGIGLNFRRGGHILPHISGGRLPWQPGWEQAAGAIRAELAPAAAQALSTGVGPRAIGAEPGPAREATTPGLPPPSSAAIPPEPLGPAGAAPAPAPPIGSERFGPVPPPPTRPTPPAWFKPEEAQSE